MFYFFLHCHYLLQVTGALYVIVCHCASVDRAAMLSLGPEAMLYQNHQVQFRGIFYPDPPSNMSLLIFYLSGFCIWRRLLESAAFTPTNGHYWDPIATHHTTRPKCVYFQFYNFLANFFSSTNNIFLHPTLQTWSKCFSLTKHMHFVFFLVDAIKPASFLNLVSTFQHFFYIFH